MKLGILPLGRPTFDVPFAEQKLASMLQVLETTSHDLFGPRELLFDERTAGQAIKDLKAENVDHVLVLQVTFTDASTIVAVASEFDQPLSVWAIPEPRLGGRLRLNAFCGLNLAAHALSLNGREFGWLYCDPEAALASDIFALLAGERPSGMLKANSPPAATAGGERIAEAVSGRRVARIGDHPAGFSTCEYDADAMRAMAGVEVDVLSLDYLFETARAADDSTVQALHATVEAQLSGLGDVDPQELDRSLRLKASLGYLRSNGNYDAFAIRCWPETFTEYGGAVCGPASMMGEAHVPCACEADVYGALTQLILQETAQAPVFLTDLVDMDRADNTGVVWHCGQAPLSMCDPDEQPSATIHTNRKQPLLYQFPLKPGPVTFMRISQSFKEPKMVLVLGEMLRRPMAFTGTSGVVRFERNADRVLNDIIASGLEHHMALAYGDHRAALRGVAGALDLPVLEL